MLESVVPAQAGTQFKNKWAPAFAGATALLAGLWVGAAIAQDRAPEKKRGEKKAQATHKKPTPEQIRKFNDLEKKQQK